ncbi:DUF6089 family protein [Mucilaginibacter sp. CAU 1740]|uniref:type IX secretion system protein PorG n=1 Tax=Mucilaginibacter sp. CAU 1740 TaxID=3140365 RepID=UPI00325B677B
MPKILLFIALLCFTYSLQAQTWEIGGSIGGAGYIGDLNPNYPVKVSGFSAGVFGKRNFDGYFSAKLNIAVGNIAAYDSRSKNPDFRQRNLNFKDQLREASIIGEFNFMNYIPDAGPNKYTPYIFTGIGVTSYAPRAQDFRGREVGLRQLKTEGQARPYGNNTVVVPYGLGIKYNLSGKFTVMTEMGYRYAFTDYLDDVSGVYADKGRFTTTSGRLLSDRSGELTGKYIGTIGSQRGDSKSHDTYFFLNFTIAFTFVTSNCYY